MEENVSRLGGSSMHGMFCRAVLKSRSTLANSTYFEHPNDTKTMTLSKAEGGIFANKTNILLAKSQRQIASWLPPRAARDEPSIQPDIEDEEGDFSVGPELYVKIYGCSDTVSS